MRIKRNKFTLGANFIKDWREYRNLTQVQLGEAIGVTQAHVSRIEGGKMPWSQITLEAIAKALQCNRADLLLRSPTDKDRFWSVWEHHIDRIEAEIAAREEEMKALAKQRAKAAAKDKKRAADHRAA